MAAAADSVGTRPLANRRARSLLGPPGLAAADLPPPDHLAGVSQVSDHELTVIVLEPASVTLAASKAVLGPALAELRDIRVDLDRQ